MVEEEVSEGCDLGADARIRGLDGDVETRDILEDSTSGKLMRCSSAERSAQTRDETVALRRCDSNRCSASVGKPAK